MSDERTGPITRLALKRRKSGAEGLVPTECLSGSDAAAPSPGHPGSKSPVERNSSQPLAPLLDLPCVVWLQIISFIPRKNHRLRFALVGGHVLHLPANQASTADRR